MGTAGEPALVLSGLTMPTTSQFRRIAIRGRGYAVSYIAIRNRVILGYVEYLGPFWSTPNESARDAARLYGKKDHTVAALRHSSASKFMLRNLNEGYV